MILLALSLASCTILIFICVIWLWYLRSNNPSIIDGCWSIGIFLAGSVYMLVQLQEKAVDIKTIVAWLLLLTWALRLAGYIWVTRILKNKIDPRYETLSDNWQISKKIGFLLNYLFQGLLMLIMGLPFLFIPNSTHNEITNLSYIAITMTLIGIMGETVADWQLSQFKRNSAGHLCNQGLWAYSRHPNYFFELIIWFGFALLAWQPTMVGWLCFISPLLLFIIFVFITGPITEQQMLKSKGNIFTEYKRTTSFIIPWVRTK